MTGWLVAFREAPTFHYCDATNPTGCYDRPAGNWFDPYFFEYLLPLAVAITVLMVWLQSRKGAGDDG